MWFTNRIGHVDCGVGGTAAGHVYPRALTFSHVHYLVH